MKILVVEDNQKLANSLKRGLEQEGYAVDCLYEGEAAERRLSVRSKDYDLVVLDIMLPGKSGLEVCSTLREENITVPILMLTARDTIGDKIAGLDSGADDYVIKPFSFEEVLARIRALLRRPKESIKQTLTAGEISLNTTEKSVTVSEKTVPLTLREYSILEYFIRNQNQVVTRDQLLSHVWDFSFDSFSNVVDVHVKNLRKKLGKYGEHLETKRGVGYKLKI